MLIVLLQYNMNLRVKRIEKLTERFTDVVMMLLKLNVESYPAADY